MKQFLRHFLVLSILFLSVTSCKVSQHYSKPQVATDSLYRDNSIKDEKSLGALPWQKVFGDSLLQNLIREGVANNLDLQVAYTRVRQAEAFYSQSRAALYPTLNATLGVNESRLSEAQGFGIRTHMSQFNLGLASSWEADIWGRLSSAKRSNLALLLQSQAEAKAVQSGLIANIANLYYQLVTLDQKLAITEITAKNWDATITTMQKLKSSARVTEAAVVQSKAQRYDVLVSILQIRQQIRETENALSVLLGSDPQAIKRGTLAAHSAPDVLKTGLPALLLSNRPDVYAAELRYRSTFELTNSARAAFYPALTLTGSGGLNSLSLDKLINPTSIAANIAAGLTQPIFNRRQLKTNLKISEEEQLSAYLDFKYKLLNAGREVSDALFLHGVSKDKIIYRTQQVEELQKSVSYTEKLLINGFANYLEVITARQTLLTAEIGAVDAKLEQLQAIVTFYRALGGGWN